MFVVSKIICKERTVVFRARRTVDINLDSSVVEHRY